MRKLRVAAAVAVACLMAVPAGAATLLGSYVVTGTGAGLIDGEAWRGRFTIRMAADTGKAISDPGDPGVTILPLVGSALVDLEFRPPLRLGFGTRLGHDAGDDTVAQLKAAPVGKENAVLLDFRTPSAISLLQSFGPIEGLDIWRFGEWRDVPTSGGLLSILAIANLRFSGEVRAVAAIPEPGSWALLITGFGLVGLSLRRRAAVRA
ncbi:MAG: PEPxxWA-CTERM sorting domain-containing protein [Sphingomonadaceae bacterium]